MPVRPAAHSWEQRGPGPYQGLCFLYWLHKERARWEQEPQRQQQPRAGSLQAEVLNNTHPADKTGRGPVLLCLGLKHKDSPRKARIQVVCGCGENDSWRCLQLPAKKTTANFNSSSRTVCFLPAKSRPTPPKPASPTSQVWHRGSRAKSASHLLKSNHCFLFPL